MPFTVGPTEFIIVLIVAVMIFGIAKLPHIGGTVGRAMWEFTKSQAESENPHPRPRTADETRVLRPPDRAR